MIDALRKARTYHLCECCHQLIEPGEVYRFQQWAPWECHPDGDKTWMTSHACRWCADRYWKHTDGDGWWASVDGPEWAEAELFRWLGEAEVSADYYHIPDFYHEPLWEAQAQAREWMAKLNAALRAEEGPL